MDDSNYGYVRINLQNFMKEHGVSKSKLTFKAELQRTQLNLYLKNEIQRVDLGVLARICSALECEISDILEYVPAEKE